MSLGLPATILRPVGFMDAFGAPRSRAEYSSEFSERTLAHHSRIQFVATYDIGWFAARALEEPEKYAGRVIPLAGDQLSINTRG